MSDVDVVVIGAGAAGLGAATSLRQAGRSALVRHAFELSLDRSAIVHVVYDGLYTPVAQANSPSSPYYVASIQPPARDVAKAKALLAQAGVKPPVPVSLIVANSADAQQVGEVMQAMAGEAGFAVKITAMEFASSLQAARLGYTVQSAHCYTTLRPCFGCLKELYQAGVGGVRYLNEWTPSDPVEAGAYRELISAMALGKSAR